MDIFSEISDDSWKSVFDELGGESERACAIVGAAYLDDLLLKCLEGYLLENPDSYDELLNPDNSNAPLGSFGSKITMAYAIGLINQDDLKAFRKIKRIRNRFAHDLQLSFSADDISDHCKDLAGMMPDAQYISTDPSAREIYQAAIATYSGKLGGALHFIRNYEFSGGVGFVLRLSNELSEALGKDQ